MSTRSSSIPAFLSKAELKRLKTLGGKKGRESSGAFIVDGWKPVAEALASSWTVQTVIVDPDRIDAHGDQVLRVAERRSVEIKHGRAVDLRSLSDVVNDQGVVAVVEIRPSPDLKLPTSGDLLVLDGVSDPGNVGTLIRTADWFGMAGVVLGPGCASLYNEKVVRATMGSLFHLPVEEVRDLSAVCRALRSQGVTLAGAEVSGGSWTSWVTPSRIALVLGSEAHGISADVQTFLSVRVSIPRVGNAESLNVAGAGAVLMASLADHRKQNIRAAH